MRRYGLFVALLFVLFFVPRVPVRAADCRQVLQNPITKAITCNQGETPCVGSGLTGYCCPTGVQCPANTMPPGVTQTYLICDAVPDSQKGACTACMGQTGDETPGTWTAIGCVRTDPNDLLKTILTLGIGVAGGIAFLLILFGGLQIMTSAGNPEQLNAGRELVTSAVTGLILIIFSIFLLQFIGVSIIGIPGFGGGNITPGPGR